MSENPYSPPHTISQFPPVGQNPTGPIPEYLLRVATLQRYVLVALLANIVINFTLFAYAPQDPFSTLVLLAAGLLIVVLSIVSIFLLAKEVFNNAVGAVFAFMMIIPVISLIVLLVVNQKATRLLQTNGIKVGFMGAKQNSI